MLEAQAKFPSLAGSIPGVGGDREPQLRSGGARAFARLPASQQDRGIRYLYYYLSILESREAAKPVPTFKDVAADWEAVIGPDLKRGTRISYANAIKVQLHPTFGNLPISAVTPERVEAWWVQVRKSGLSRGSIQQVRNLLRAICRRAVSLTLLPTNPVDRIEGRLGKNRGEIRKRPDYLLAEDLAVFLATAERVCPRKYPVFLTMATCGLRVGGAVGLEVGDLDGTEWRLHIRRTVRRGYVDSPKSGKGGIVDVPPTTMAVLERIKGLRGVEAAVNGTEARWLFPSQYRPNMPLTPEGIGKAFTKVLRAAGLRKIRPHDLRHTYATLAIQAGVNILNVSRQLRHASIATTADTYAHAVPGGNRAAADVMEGILIGQTATKRNPRATSPRNPA